MAKVRVDATGCWIWTGATHRGYGCLGRSRSRGWIAAHRFAYEHFVGAIPEGTELHHVCEHRSCVNPEHLLPVTLSEHRAIDHVRLYCPKGHLKTGWHSDGSRRRCLACHREQSRDRRRRLKARAT